MIDVLLGEPMRKSMDLWYGALNVAIMGFRTVPRSGSTLQNGGILRILSGRIARGMVRNHRNGNFPVAYHNIAVRNRKRGEAMVPYHNIVVRNRKTAEDMVRYRSAARSHPANAIGAASSVPEPSRRISGFGSSTGLPPSVEACSG